MGSDGFVKRYGGYLGATIQGRVPETALRRGLGLLAFALGVRYGVLALTQ